MSKTYTEGRDYRAALGGRPSQSSTPAARETPQAPNMSPAFPITRHAIRPKDHVETVGWHPDGGFVEPTTPNADARTGTDRFYGERAKTEPYNKLNRDKMKSTS